MSTSERKLKHRLEVRASILEAAEKMVLNKGWEALSIRKIAEAIDYSVPVIYDHFVNKDALHLEFVKRGFNLLNSQLKEAQNSTSDSEEQIRTIGYAYWKFSHEQKEYYRLMFGLGIPSCEAVKEISELNQFVKIVKEPISILISHSKQENLDVMVKFKSFWSSLHGLISINILDISGRKNRNTEVLEDFINNFLSGIRH